MSQRLRHKERTWVAVATVIVKKDKTAERIFFEEQALVSADRFAATADQQHLTDFLP